MEQTEYMLAALKELEKTQTVVEKNVSPDLRRIVNDSLFESLANPCSGVKSVYAAYDQRRAQRPKQHEDYCLERECRRRRDADAPPGRCKTIPNTAEMNNKEVYPCLPCEECQQFEKCPPQVPCQNRYRRHTLSTGGTWKKGYEEQQKRHELLTGGIERDAIAVGILLQWKHELDQRYLTNGSSGSFSF